MPATSSTAPPASGTTTSASTRGPAATPGTAWPAATLFRQAAPTPGDFQAGPAGRYGVNSLRANAPSVLVLVTRTAMNTATQGNADEGKQGPQAML